MDNDELLFSVVKPYVPTPIDRDRIKKRRKGGRGMTKEPYSKIY
jgi:hypothetical protein